jgi:hypothetical protein
MHGTKLNNLMKKEIKDSDLPCHTQWIHGVGGEGWVELDQTKFSDLPYHTQCIHQVGVGGLNWMKRGKNFNFAPPQACTSSCHHYSRSNTVRLRAKPVSLAYL